VTVFIAFYSYKGGVGRSMALANVGWMLAKLGKRVALIDMDLEAPSLHGLADLAPPPETPPAGGLVELASAYAQDGRLPALEGHYYPVAAMTGPGALWVMPAGRLDASYQQALARLSWGELHPTQATQGFVEALRASLAATLRPHYVLIDSRTGFSDVGGLTTHRLADQVVLIFNLTRGCLEGTVRAYGSMTAREPSPHIVLVASPVPPVAAEAGTIIDQRLASAREHMPLGLRYGQDILRIDYDPRLVLGDQLAVLAEGDFPAADRYAKLAKMLLDANPDEVLTVVARAYALQREGQVQEAIAELRRFVDAHPTEAEGHQELGRLLLTSGQSREAVDELRRAVALDDALASAHHGLGVALLAQKDAAGAVRALRRAEVLGESTPRFYEALAAALQATSDVKGADEARRHAALALIGGLPAASKEFSDASPEDLRARFLVDMSRKAPYSDFLPERFWEHLMGSLILSGSHKRAVVEAILQGLPKEQVRALARLFEEHVEQVRRDIGPDAKELHVRVASAMPDSVEDILSMLRGDRLDGPILLHAAMNSSGEESSLQLLRRAASAGGDYPVVHRHLALVLAQSNGPDQLDRLRESLAHWPHALKSDPEDGGLEYQWGATLSVIARKAEPEEGAQLFREACEHYQRAVALDSSYYPAFRAWAAALFMRAQLTDGSERARLLQDACQQYARAVKVKPDDQVTLDYWATALLHLAGAAPDAESARAYAAQAAEKARAANAIAPGSADYNLACALSRLGEYDGALTLLDGVFAKEPERRAQALNDADLEPLWVARPPAAK
jgi:tetratricopeptide (TPR) repeat protein